MVRWARSIVGVLIILAVFGMAGFVLRTFPVHAQTQTQFPGITSGADWNFSAKSPDPNLTWLFKPNGANQVITGKTAHVLRTRSIGRNKGTSLRVYYANRPKKVSITINVTNCELNAPHNWAGDVTVTLGGIEQYRQPTDQYKKDHYYEKREYINAGDKLTTTSGPTPIDPDPLTSGVQYNKSPVCANPGTYKIPLWIDREGCNKPGPNGTCKGAGNNTFTLDKNNGKKDFNPPNVTLDGNTYTVDFPATGAGNGSMGYDSATGLFYADLDINLDSNGDPGLPNDPNIMQRMTFRVVANDVKNAANGNMMSAKLGYKFVGSESDGSKYFGLQGNGGTDNAYADYGQKYAVPFGMDCNANSDTMPGKVLLYDPDVQGFGASYAMVYQRNPNNGNVTRLSHNDYESLSDNSKSANVKWDPGDNDRIQLTAGSNQNSKFTVKELKRGWQYMLVFVNPNTAGTANPAGNVWSLLLPKDSINGLVNCRYDLTPKVSVTPLTFNMYGDNLTVHGWIKNNENSTYTGNHDWSITRAVFATKPADATRTSVLNTKADEAVCAFITRLSGPPLSCTSVYTGNYLTADKTVNDDQTINDTVGPYPAGSYVCYITSIKDPTWDTTDDNKWANSVMQCSVAGVKPRLKVSGYDVKIGGTIDTSLSQFANATEVKTYGSWGEYGVFSNGTNSNMASGAGLFGGNVSPAQASWSSLTFANIPPYGNHGGVAPPAYNPGTGATLPSPNLAGQTYHTGDDSTLRYNGTLYINGNQLYDDTYASIGDIPNVRIVADNIVIGAGVTRIDAWLIARKANGTFGNISTCGSVAGFQPMGTANLLKTNTCNTQLVLNGPVIANSLYAYRTYDTAAADPAEVFNLRANGFLAAYAGNNSPRPVASTDIVTELPPRF